VEHAIGRAEAAHAHAMNAPCAFAGALETRAQRAHCVGGVDHVLAFEQSGYAGLPDRERAEDEGAVRDRFVAGHARAAFQSARAPIAARSSTISARSRSPARSATL